MTHFSNRRIKMMTNKWSFLNFLENIDENFHRYDWNVCMFSTNLRKCFFSEFISKNYPNLCLFFDRNVRKLSDIEGIPQNDLWAQFGMDYLYLTVMAKVYSLQSVHRKQSPDPVVHLVPCVLLLHFQWPRNHLKNLSLSGKILQRI